MKDADKDGGIK